MAERRETPGEHQPVMVAEVWEYLACAPGQVVVDGCLGSGGHGAAILDRIGPGGWLIGIDRDPEAIGRARRRLAGCGRVSLVNDNHANLEVILSELGVTEVDGVFLDCGPSLEHAD